MKQKNVGILQMIACAILWSTAGVLFKYIPWHAMVIAGVRSFFGGVVVLFFMFGRNMHLRITRRSLLAGVFMGATCMLFVAANKLTTAANAIVLQFTAPIFLVLFSVLFLHQTFARQDVLAVVCTMVGISLFFLDQLTGGRMVGNLLAVAAGCAMGLMYLFMGEIGEEERMSSIVIAEVFTVLVSLPFYFTTTIEISYRPVLFILLLGVFQLGIPYILYALAAGKCPPLACCLLAALEPLLNPVWVMIFYGEIPGIWALIGGVVVIGTVTVWSIYNGRKQRTGETA